MFQGVFASICAKRLSHLVLVASMRGVWIVSIVCSGDVDKVMGKKSRLNKSEHCIMDFIRMQI